MYIFFVSWDIFSSRLIATRTLGMALKNALNVMNAEKSFTNGVEININEGG